MADVWSLAERERRRAFGARPASCPFSIPSSVWKGNAASALCAHRRASRMCHDTHRHRTFASALSLRATTAKHQVQRNWANCMQMTSLHNSLLHALLTCHLFDSNGRLQPWVFPMELKVQEMLQQRVRKHSQQRPGAAAVADTGKPARRERTKAHLDDLIFDFAQRWPYPRIGDSGGPSASYGGVSDEAVRMAWAKACPWLHTPLPEWWSFKVRHLHPPPLCTCSGPPTPTQCC